MIQLFDSQLNHGDSRHTTPRFGLRIVHGGQGVLRRLSEVSLSEHNLADEELHVESLRTVSPATEQPPAVEEFTLDELIGMEIGGFQIEAKLHDHGLWSTFVAQHAESNLRAIVRAIDLDRTVCEPPLFKLHTQRAHQAKQLSHPYIMNVMYVLSGETPQGLLLLMTESADGVNLADFIAQNGAIPEERALVMAQGVAEGLAAGFGKGLLHGGICPANIFVTADHKPKLADFCWNVSHVLPGPAGGDGASPTPDAVDAVNAEGASLVYCAPEHFSGSAIDQRADIYALGATLYHMLTGRPPFTASSVDELVGEQARTTVREPRRVNPLISEKTSALVMSMLATNRNQRMFDYQSLLLMIQTVLLRQRRQRLQALLRPGMRA